MLRTVECLSNIFQRYYANLSNSYFREHHELERLQRMSQSEHLPAPIPVDFSIHRERRVPRSTRTAVPIQSDSSGLRSDVMYSASSRVTPPLWQIPGEDTRGPKTCQISMLWSWWDQEAIRRAATRLRRRREKSLHPKQPWAHQALACPGAGIHPARQGAELAFKLVAGVPPAPGLSVS